MSTAYGERLAMLHEARRRLYELPTDTLFELPGRPNVIYAIRNYTPSNPAHGGDRAKAAQECRADMPFLFKAFETGQIGPRRLSRLVGENKPRSATIHEFLDWTVTGVEARQEGEYDFSGFRMLVLLPRERIMWPAPGQFDRAEPRRHAQLGAPLDPLPGLQVKGKPLSAATIRAGPDYIEVPFVATHENKRGRGFGRCIVEACEEIARAVGLPRLLLCSTCEASVSATWRHLGFSETSEQQLEAWGVEDSDLVHMQNTLQMHKEVPPRRTWRPLVIRHQAFVARVYLPADQQALSGSGGGKSCAPRPGRHDMGAVSGYGFGNSAATSAATSSWDNGANGGGGGGGGTEQRDGGHAAAAANGRLTPSGGGAQQQQQQQQEQQSRKMATPPPGGAPLQQQQQASQPLQQQQQPLQQQPALPPLPPLPQVQQQPGAASLRQQPLPRAQLQQPLPPQQQPQPQQHVLPPSQPLGAPLGVLGGPGGGSGAPPGSSAPLVGTGPGGGGSGGNGGLPPAAAPLLTTPMETN